MKINDINVEEIRKRYPVNTRIRLIYMDDPQRPEPGTLGTVTGVGDLGEIHMNWDNGSTLNLIDDEDAFEVVTEEDKDELN